MTKLEDSTKANNLAYKLIEFIASTDISELNMVHNKGFTLSIKKMKKASNYQSTVDFNSEYKEQKK